MQATNNKDNNRSLQLMSTCLLLQGVSVLELREIINRIRILQSDQHILPCRVKLSVAAIQLTM